MNGCIFKYYNKLKKIKVKFFFFNLENLEEKKCILDFNLLYDYTHLDTPLVHYKMKIMQKYSHALGNSSSCHSTDAWQVKYDPKFEFPSLSLSEKDMHLATTSQKIWTSCCHAVMK